MDIKIRIQASKNYQVYEIEGTVPADKVRETSDKFIALANAEVNKLADAVGGKSVSNTPAQTTQTTIAKLSQKQIDFLVKMGGSATETFNSYQAFNDRITELKTK